MPGMKMLLTGRKKKLSRILGTMLGSVATISATRMSKLRTATFFGEFIPHQLSASC